MRYFLLLFGITILFANSTSSIQACGGGANYRIEWLGDNDVIIRGTVVDVDERGYKRYHSRT